MSILNYLLNTVNILLYPYAISYIQTEITRILDNSQINPFSDGSVDLTDLTDFDDRSDETVGLFYSNVKWRLQTLNYVIS